MADTIRDMLVAALVARGATVAHTRSGKYLAYMMPGYPHTIYLGKAGALRVGSSITGSIPNSRLKALLLTKTPK